MPSYLPMFRSLKKGARSLVCLLVLIKDLIREGFRFARMVFRSHTSLSAEILFLRKQLAFYEERQTQPRRLTDGARASLLFWSRLFDWKDALVIVKPDTLIGWHRKGFKLFWRWKSQAGRPQIPEKIRKLIVQMAEENPTWRQARVAAELSVKLGIWVSPRTVRAYWPPEPDRRGPRRPSSQHWATFVRNHAQSIVACDFLVAITPRFRALYIFLLMEVGTRRILHYNVTAHPVLAERGGTQLKTPRPVLLVDTREQNPFQFSRFGRWFAGVEKKALKVGDYSVVGLEAICVVERKDLSDLVRSCTVDRTAFTNRLRLMAEYPHRLLVITGALSQVKSPYSHSRIDPNRITQFLIAHWPDCECLSYAAKRTS
jgi:hypothetical protein